MAFIFGMAIALEFLALAAGVGMLIWGYRTAGVGTTAARVFGYIITIAISFVFLCTVFHAANFKAKGYYKSPMASMCMKKQDVKSCGCQSGAGMMQKKVPGAM